MGAGEQVNDGLLDHGYSCVQAWPVGPIQLLLLVGHLSANKTVAEARVLQALEDCGLGVQEAEKMVYGGEGILFLRKKHYCYEA